MASCSQFQSFRRNPLALGAVASENSGIATNQPEPKMLEQIVSHTPTWVFILFFGLIGLGLMQSTARRITLRRAVLVPTAMVALSLYGTVAAFGSSTTSLLAWLVSALCAVAMVLQSPVPDGTRYEQDTRRFHVPGSWLPLALLMGLFLTKYFVGASTAMQPELSHNEYFVLTFSALYGAFAGAFFGRALRFVRLARTEQSPLHMSMAASTRV
jgi:hypothetical protein